jgi:uncharacterized membrane protein YqjE
MDAPAEAKAAAADGTLRSAGSALVGLLGTRIELFGVELREEAVNLQWLVAAGVLAAFLLGSALVLVAVLVAAAFWDTHRLVALAVVAGIYALAAVAVVLRVRTSLAKRPPPFEATVREFEADLEALRTTGPGTAT